MTGNPLKKGFPLSGYVQVSYSANKMLIYNKINLAQSFRLFENICDWF